MVVLHAGYCCYDSSDVSPQPLMVAAIGGFFMHSCRYATVHACNYRRILRCLFPKGNAKPQTICVDFRNIRHPRSHKYGMYFNCHCFNFHSLNSRLRVCGRIPLTKHFLWRLLAWERQRRGRDAMLKRVVREINFSRYTAYDQRGPRGERWNSRARQSASRPAMCKSI